MVEDRINRFLVAVDDLQDTVGQARLLHQFGQHQRHGWVPLGWLEDERIARRDGRAEFPHRDHGREVKRSNSRRNAQWLTHGIHIDAGAGAVGILTLQQVRCAQTELSNLQTTDHVALCIGDGFAMLTAQRLGQLVHVTVQQADEFHQNPRAALRVGRAPRNLRLGRALNSRIHIRRIGQRNLRLNLTRCGVIDVCLAVRSPRNTLAVDEMP